jgi:hypothetical protein
MLEGCLRLLELVSAAIRLALLSSESPSRPHIQRQGAMAPRLLRIMLNVDHMLRSTSCSAECLIHIYIFWHFSSLPVQLLIFELRVSSREVESRCKSIGPGFCLRRRISWIRAPGFGNHRYEVLEKDGLQLTSRR